MENETNTNQEQSSLFQLGVDLDMMDHYDRQRVLVVEDDPDTVLLLKQILRFAGFDVISASESEEAVNKTVEYNPDLMILDLMLPDKDGWQILDLIRKKSNVPVIVCSALGSKEQVVSGLQKGVDDYICKPFYNDEVIERVKAVLRRAQKDHRESFLEISEIGLKINFITQEVTLNDEKMALTPKEFSILSILARNAPKVVNYDEIGTEIWGDVSPDARRRTKYLVYLLRQKLEKNNASKNLIVNFDRLGYKLVTEG